MKTIWMCGLMVVLTASMYGQQLDRYVFGSAGASWIHTNGNLSCTVGQGGLAGALRQTNLDLLVGFQQPGSEVVTGVSYPESDIALHVFPNPFFHRLTLNVTLETAATMRCSLVDASGKCLQAFFYWEQSAGRDSQVLEVNGVPSGWYTLEIVVLFRDGRSVQRSLPVICLR